MNVKSFCDNKNVRKYFSKNFKKPKIEFSQNIIESSFRLPSYIGAAFEIGILLLISSGESKKINEVRQLYEPWLAEIGFEVDDEFLRIYDDLLNNREVDFEWLTYVVLRFAFVETYKKIGQFSLDVWNDTVINGSDEVRSLLELYYTRGPKFKEIVLKPSFESEFGLYGEGDFISGDILIDVKTTKKGEVKRDDFNQLLTYFILAKSCERFKFINKFGFYYSRQNQLVIFNSDDLFPNNNFSEHFAELINMHNHF